jgi:hypothetical protein
MAPLVPQLARWFAHTGSAASLLLLDAAVEALADKSDGALRELAADALAIFFRFSLRTRSQHRSSGSGGRAGGKAPRLDLAAEGTAAAASAGLEDDVDQRFAALPRRRRLAADAAMCGQGDQRLDSAPPGLRPGQAPRRHAETGRLARVQGHLQGLPAGGARRSPGPWKGAMDLSGAGGGGSLANSRPQRDVVDAMALEFLEHALASLRLAHADSPVLGSTQRAR